MDGDHHEIVLYRTLFIITATLLFIFTAFCTVAWVACYCGVYKKRFEGSRRIKAFMKHQTNNNGSVGGMQLDLLPVTTLQTNNDSYMGQPYEVPRPTNLVDGRNNHSEGTPTAQQNERSSSYYEEPLKKVTTQQSTANQKTELSASPHGKGAAGVDRDKSQVVQVTIEEPHFYDDPDDHEPRSGTTNTQVKQEFQDKRSSHIAVENTLALEEPHPEALLETESIKEDTTTDYCEPHELEFYINTCRPEYVSSSSSISDENENEDAPTIIHEIPRTASQAANTVDIISSGYQVLEMVEVDEVKPEENETLYENVERRDPKQSTKLPERSSYYNLDTLQQNFPLHGDDHSKEQSHCIQSPGYEISPSFFGSSDNISDSEVDMKNLWEPQGTSKQIHKEMSLRKYPLLENANIQYLKGLGEGEFGQVHHGEWSRDDGKVLQVAVKELKRSATEEERTKLLREAALMGQFKHRHVVRLYGVANEGKQVSLIMEHLEGGDLKKYLQAIKRQSGRKSGLEKKLLRFCTHIADAMAYLSGRGFIHRDLAARNILLNENLQCKIADFGMSRDLEGAYYYRSKGGRIPLKWTAPEAILYRKYSSKSDVWSYGMVMYEIWSLGHEPFEDFKVEEIINKFDCGFCQYPPPGCPRPVYHIMVKCWHPDAHQRPTFHDIFESLKTKAHSLLRWEERDTIGSEASTLGGPLQYGALLHQDLQQKYNLY